MLGTIAALTERLACRAVPPEVMPWASPVPFFGQLQRATVATVGINPSNLEFVDSSGRPLTGEFRRLATLDSLRIGGWPEADGSTILKLARSCSGYFRINPYRRWFDVLDRVLAVSGRSYYGGNLAAHIDLVPYATFAKWSDLSRAVRRSLIYESRRLLGELVAASGIETLVLNGRSVVSAFVTATESVLNVTSASHLDLARAGGRRVEGWKWHGVVHHIAGHDLGREVRVIGFNHNLQSSFGITRTVMDRIGIEVGVACG